MNTQSLVVKFFLGAVFGFVIGFSAVFLVSIFSDSVFAKMLLSKHFFAIELLLGIILLSSAYYMFTKNSYKRTGIDELALAAAYKSSNVALLSAFALGLVALIAEDVGILADDIFSTRMFVSIMVIVTLLSATISYVFYLKHPNAQ